MSHEAIRGPVRGLPRVLCARRFRPLARDRRATRPPQDVRRTTLRASVHARIGCAQDGRRTRRTSRETSLEQWKGHTLSARERWMGNGRVRACPSGMRTFRSASDGAPEGRPTGESNPNASTIAGGAAPAVGHDKSRHGCHRGARGRRRCNSVRGKRSRTRDRTTMISTALSASSI